MAVSRKSCHYFRPVCSLILQCPAHGEQIVFGDDVASTFEFGRSAGNIVTVSVSGNGEEVDAINLVVEVVGVSGDAPVDAIESLTRVTTGTFTSAVNTTFDGPASNRTSDVGTVWFGPIFAQPFPKLPSELEPFATLSLDTSGVGDLGATWELRFVDTPGTTDIQRGGVSPLNLVLGTATVTVAGVPEPSAMVLAASGLLMLGTARIFRRRRSNELDG